MWEIILDTVTDSVRLLPFLLLTYLAMEYLEHKAGERMQVTVRHSGKWGPFLGSILGVFPQCGFSAAAANLFAGRVISLGTLLAIYLSTSDEMLPILISEHVGADRILKILGIKIIVGMAAGFVTDLTIHRPGHDHMDFKIHEEIHQLCDRHNCHCEEGILRSALKHTLEIFAYILIITFILNIVISLIGENFLAEFILNRPVIGEMITGLIGLIPNCAASVVITQLYLGGVLTAGAMLSGLLAGTGVGLLVLLRVNRRPAENIKIIIMLYVIGVAAGILIDAAGVII